MHAEAGLAVDSRAATRFDRLTGRDLLIAVATWIVAALVFFRSTIFSRMRSISGNVGDARLVIFLHEHWFNVAGGSESWLSPPFFYPATRTLGYSDTLVLNQIFYAPLRLVGFDQFVSFQLTLMAVHLVGFLGWFVVFMTVFRSRRTWALWSAIACAFANSQFLTVEHSQLWLSGWIPWVILSTVAAVSATSTRRRATWGFVSGAGIGLIAYSSFYVAWMWALASILFFIVVIMLGGRRRLRSILVALRASAAGCFGATIGLGLVAVPFVMTYLPVLRSSGARTYSDAMALATHPRDLLNVSGNNYVWGSLARSQVPAARLFDVEYAVAVTPIVLIAALASGLGAVLVIALRRRSQCQVDTTWAAVSIAGCVAMVAMILLPMRFSWGSAWVIPWNVLPGAHAIRAIGRSVLVATPLALITIGAFGASIHHRWSGLPIAGSRLRPLVLGLALLIVLEQFNTQQVTQISRPVELDRLARVPPPPPDCRSFYLLDSVATNFWHAEVGAMLIAQQVELPTVNGYSGLAPAGFDFTDIYAPGYQERVRTWASDRSIAEGLCAYDPTTHQWGPG